jgi:IS1 family transposase
MSRKLYLEDRKRVLHMLVEGNSIRSTSRVCKVAINTVIKLLIDVGTACSKYHHENLLNLTCKRVQLDEVWSFCYCKDKNVANLKEPVQGAGDVWTWTAFCADTKLVASWFVGDRDADSANTFIEDLAKRLTHRVQLTSDGHKPYLHAIKNAFGNEVDYAMLVKIYGVSESPEKRYSPPECIQCRNDHASTSFVERNNLTIRMASRRFTRLTNAFSKKIENHIHAISIHFMHYNFARKHSTIRKTPAMAAGLSDHIWTLEEILALAGNTLDSGSMI